MKATFFAFTIAYVFLASPALAETCTGKWGHQDLPPKFEILSDSSLQYCLDEQCWTEKYHRHDNKGFWFRVGDSAAIITAEPIGTSRYLLKWQAGIAHTAGYFHCK